MELIAIACHHCGAPLDIPPQAELVTCQHCRTHLAVRRNESVAWTERIDWIEQRTKTLSDTTDNLEARLARVEYERSLQRLDQKRRIELAIREEEDSANPLTKRDAIYMLLAFGGFFGFIMFAASRSLGITIWILTAVCAAIAAWMGEHEDHPRCTEQQRSGDSQWN